MALKKWYQDLVLFVLASPVLVVRGAVRAVRHIRFSHTATQPWIRCRTCGGQIPMVGFWRCRCGFTYQGHLLRICPVCASFPAIVRCYRCGATEGVRR